jgi:pre-mRNA cleavage complex 2 protein Pcf11
LTVKETAAADAIKRDTELRSMHVVIPPGDEAKMIKCPICKEAIETAFLEDDEEWVWKNALKRDDKVWHSSMSPGRASPDLLIQIFHATCHSEAMASANALVTRLKTETSGSRSVTPSLRGTPPKASGSPLSGNAKRKAESDVKTEHDTAPPAKKMALAA